MENQFFVDSEHLSSAALEKKHRLETDPSSRKNHMEYLPGMEIIESDVCKNVMEQMNTFDYSKYTEDDVKQALLQIASKAQYIDDGGATYYSDLYNARYPLGLDYITAEYTQSGTVYTTDSLDSLKADLVVTAYYDNSTTADVTAAAVLSGTLTEGTSTITATYS